MVFPVRVSSVRPLVRYVDDQQAVIDTHFQTTVTPANEDAPPPESLMRHTAQVLVEINGMDGFHDEGECRLTLDDGHGAIRFEVVQPDRWWPAGMGEQPLYQLRIGLVMDDQLVDHQEITFGLTSVRRDARFDLGYLPTLLINGQVIDVHDVVLVDRVHEQGLLPAAGGSVLAVRDHYGSDLLYDAADRAGILLIQCVPIDALGSPDATIDEQVERLASHPSLAGYFVGHLGSRSDAVARQIRTIDPTRAVFRHLPLGSAA